jgi:fructokinase
MTPDDRLIVVAGEALVDLVLESEGTTTRHLGGGSYNTARTLGRLGLVPVFVGRLSNDVNGRALRAGLAESDVRLDGVVDTDEPTTFALVELDGNGAASYRFYADGTSISGLLLEQARAVMPPLPAALHVGGLGLVFEPQAGAIAGLVREAPSTTLVMLDPNCRPGAAPYPALHRARLREVLTRVDVVKASEEDLVYMEPDQPAMQTARDLLLRGPSVVLLTQGSRGAIVISPTKQAAVPAPPPVKVVDTIGAGDAFGGGWLAAWIAGGLGREDLDDFDALVRTTRFAAEVAARTCEQAGAEPPYALRLDDEWCIAAPVHRSRPAARTGD